MRLRSREEVAAILEREDQVSAQRLKADATNADDFEWPDEQEKKRYARRQEMRARGERIEEDEEFEQELRELEAEDDRLPVEVDELEEESRVEPTDQSEEAESDKP